MNVENRIKKKKPATTQFHPREMSALLVLCFLSTLHHRDFFFSPCHSIPLSLSPPSVLHLSWSHSVHCSGLSLPLSSSLSLSGYRCINALSTSSERTQVSAVTALVQGMFVNHSQLLSAIQEGHSFTVRLTESVCVCVCADTLSHCYFFFFFFSACLLT